MRASVTVVVVAQQGGEWLEQTLEGLGDQTRTPDRVIGIGIGSSERVRAQLAEGGATHVVSTGGRLPFGAAVAQGLEAIPNLEPSENADASSERRGPEWIWLLAEDTRPEPKALARLLRTVESAPSVAVVGPKLVDWDRPDHIIELGQSLTRFGSRWKLRRQELDQQQYDHFQDVLGVSSAGMLVRRDVWEQLGGFDPALPVVDDGLDLCVRARLAGHRVVVAPLAKVRFGQLGVAGPRIERRRAVLRAAHREDRAAQTHRRISYAPAVVAFFMWLGLPLYGLGRVLWALIREQPGQMIGEIRAAMRVFFHPLRILASRRSIKRTTTAGWPAVKPLRVDGKTVRTARMIDREAILAAQGRRREEIHFISTGGLAVLIAAVLVSLVLTWWVLANTSLTGGALAPLSDFRELWANTRSSSTGMPADPFTWVLAVLGTLTFWDPSLSIVLLYVAAIPLAAMGGWVWAAQLTESRAGRALLGLGWAVSPVLLGSLDSGRLPTLVLAVVLPWLLLAATRCRESWSWAGTASLLAAIVLACAPILLPAAAVLLIVGAVISPRGAARVIGVAIAPAVLFLPLVLHSVRAGRPLDALLDPGISPLYEAGTVWHLMLGFPEFGLEGWGGIFDAIGLGGPPATLLVGVLMLLIALLALLGIFTGRISATLLNSLLGGLGLLTAFAALSLNLAVVGSQTAPLWTGSGLAVYWLAVLTLAAIGTRVLLGAAGPITAVALVTAVIAVAPLGVKLITANTGMQPGEQQMPAIVQAAGLADPEVRTLVLTAEGSHEVRAEIVRGAGTTLDSIRTAERNPDTTPSDQRLAELVGDLASTGGSTLGQQLAGERIGFVLLADGGDGGERAQLQSTFDQHAALASAGQTDHGLLWRAVPSDEQSSDEVALIDHRGFFAGGIESLWHKTLWWVQLVVLLGLVLLALPTGEVVERPPRRKRASKRRGARVAAGASADGGPVDVVEDTADADPETVDPATVGTDAAGTEASDVDAGALETDAPESSAPDSNAPTNRTDEGGAR
ncbi:glycosyltransferase [Leucobacter sp. GX24907]